jgi:hypothetical protein
MANQRNSRKKSIAIKYAELTHTGKNRAMRDFNIIARIINPESIKAMNLSEQELEYLQEKKQALANELVIKETI